MVPARESYRLLKRKEEVGSHHPGAARHPSSGRRGVLGKSLLSPAAESVVITV